MNKLNIVYIIADQMRWDVLSCNGNSFIKTPNFQRLADSGVNFINAYSGNPVCVPARGIMATGCYSHKCMSKNAGNYNSGSIEHIHIAQILKENGYTTYGIGKAHCLPYKINPGFDVYDVSEEGRIEYFKSEGKINDPAITDDYLEYLRDKGLYGMQRAHGIGNNDIRASSSPLSEEDFVDTWSTTRSLQLLGNHIKQYSKKPFFLQLGWVKPHAPYDPPAPWNKIYDSLKIPRPHGSVEDLKHMNPTAVAYRKNHLIDQMSDAGINYSRAHYFGLISYLDFQLSRILDFLETYNLRENTFIIFTADHGDNLGDHGIFFKTVMTEGSTHIPMLLSLPGRIKPYNCGIPVGQEDIVPTLCEVAEVNPPNDMDGVSVVDMLDGKIDKHKSFVISQHGSREGMTLMMRKDNFKYCFSRYESTEELYDLSIDPYEQNNLVGNNMWKNKLVEMRNTTNQWCIDNNHETVLKSDGSLTYSEFFPEQHLVEPTTRMGIRPW